MIWSFQHVCETLSQIWSVEVAAEWNQAESFNKDPPSEQQTETAMKEARDTYTTI